MVSGWYLFKKDRKTAIRLTWFLIVVLIISVLIAVFFPNAKTKTEGKDKNTSEKAIDSLK